MLEWDNKASGRRAVLSGLPNRVKQLVPKERPGEERMDLEKDQFEDDDELSRGEEDEELGGEAEGVVEEEEEEGLAIDEEPAEEAEEEPAARPAPKAAPKKAAAPKAKAKKPAKKATKAPKAKKAKAKPKKAAKKPSKKRRREIERAYCTEGLPVEREAFFLCLGVPGGEEGCEKRKGRVSKGESAAGRLALGRGAPIGPVDNNTRTDSAFLSAGHWTLVTKRGART